MSQPQQSKSEPLPAQYLFVSQRSQNVRTKQGATLTFERGIPTHVPKGLHAEVLEKGIMPCDKDGAVVDVVTAAAVSEGQEIRVLIAPETAEDRQEAITKVLKVIVERNNSADFNAGATPKADAVSLALGWKVDQKEVRQAWVAMRPKE